MPNHLYYRDPRADDRAIGALARLGRPSDGPTPEERANALGALSRASEPIETPADVATPDPAADEAEQAKTRAIAGLLGMALSKDPNPPEATEEVAEVLDPQLKHETDARAYGALRAAAPPPAAAAPAEPEPDPDLERRVQAGAAGALAQARRSKLLEQRNKLDMEISLGESDRARGTTPKEDDAPLPNPYYGYGSSTRTVSTTRRPDMDLSADPEALELTTTRASYSRPRDPKVEREMLDELDAAEAKSRTPRKPDMDLSEDPEALAQSGNPKYAPPKDPQVERELIAELDAAEAAAGKKPAAPTNSTDAVNAALKDGQAKLEAEPTAKPAESATSKPVDKPQTQPRRETVPDDEDSGAPAINGWLLAADIMRTGGQNIASIIAQSKRDAEAVRRNRALDAERHAETEYQHGRDARGDFERERKYTDDKTAAEHNRDMSDWVHTDTSQRDWEAKENERKRAEALDAERKADNTRADQLAAETMRHNRAMEAASGAAGRETRAAREHERKLLHGAVPGIEIVDPDAWESATTTAGSRGKAQELRQTLGSAVEALQSMRDIRSRVGIADPQKNAADITAYNQAKKRYIGALGAASGSGVLQPAEYKTYSEGIPDVTVGMRDGVDKVYNWLANTSQDTALEKLSGSLDDITALVNARLGTYGGRYAKMPEPTTSTQRAQARGEDSDQPPAEDVVGPLPVTNQKRSELPKVSEVVGADSDEDTGPEDESKPFKQVMVMPDGRERRVTFADQSAYDEFIEEHKGAVPKGAKL